MTTPPHAQDGPDGRWYVLDEGTDHEVRLRSVTSVLDLLDKPALVPWSGWLTARQAFEQLPRLVAAAMRDDCGRTWARCEHEQGSCPECPCRDCTACLTRWLASRHAAESARRSDEGTRVHHAIAQWARTGVWEPVDEDIAPYLESFQTMVVDYGLQPADWELIEATVVHRDLGYAGTLDAQLRIRRERSRRAADLLDRYTPDGQPRWEQALLTVDVKTREKEDRKLYLENALQLAAYRHAPVVRLADGTEHALPVSDGAAVIQIRPDEAEIYPVLADEPELAEFMRLLEHDEWQRGRGKKVTAARTFSFPDSVAKARAADARRAKKAQKAPADAGHGPFYAQHEPKAAKKAAKKAPAKKAALPVKTVRARVLGEPSHHGPPDDIPF